MKIINISQQDADLFAMLDPFELLSLLENPTAFALGGVVGSGENIEPVAVMVGTATEKMLTIDWIAVHPSHSGMGMGEQLLLSAFKMADTGNIPELGAVISFEIGKEHFSSGAQDFFNDRLFEEERSVMGNRILTLDDLSGTPFMGQDVAKFPAPKCLSEFSSIEQKAVLEKLTALPNAESLYVPGFGKKLLDQELCFVFMDGDEPYGAILVQKGKYFLMPVLLCAESEKESTALILNAFKSALDKYGRNQDVLIKTSRKNSDTMLRKILRRDKPAKMFVAALEDYRAIL